jgi:hypothetical protein
MDSLHPYMDSLHLYMDPLHPLVCNIFNKFAGCPCFPRRFHNLYNNPCYSTNPWHPLWPSTLIQLQRGVVTSTQHFRGSTIAHWKYIFNISNGYFTESHLASWFERYHRLNLNMYLTQGGCIPPYSMVFFSLLKKLKKEFHIWLEISLQYLKWVFS